MTAESSPLPCLPDEALRRRLELLNRAPLPSALPAPTAINIGERRSRVHAQAPHRVAAGSAPSLTRTNLVKPIPGLLRRGEVVANEYGPAPANLSRPRATLARRRQKLVAGRHATTSRRRSTRQPSPMAMESHRSERGACDGFVRSFPREVVLLDLETCGLSGSALFLNRPIAFRSTIARRLNCCWLATTPKSERCWPAYGDKSTTRPCWRPLTAKAFELADGARPHGALFVIPQAAARPTPQHVDLLHLASATTLERRELPDCRLLTIGRAACAVAVAATTSPVHRFPPRISNMSERASSATWIPYYCTTPPTWLHFARHRDAI